MIAWRWRLNEAEMPCCNARSYEFAERLSDFTAPFTKGKKHRMVINLKTAKALDLDVQLSGPSWTRRPAPTRCATPMPAWH